MKCTRIPAWAALPALLIPFFLSCEKEPLPPRLEEELKACPILLLNGITTDPSGAQIGYPIYTFDYNEAGNPIDMLFLGDNFDAYNFYFRYDRRNRLTDFVTTGYQSTGAFIWHRYGYPDSHTITDTAYDYVGDINDPEPPHSSFDTYFTIDKLDEFGRIIKSIDFAELNGNLEGTLLSPPQTYAYDANGDLVRAGVTYDNKINLYQTNSVWMLINNDYSVHNPLNQVYSPGLPLTIPKYNPIGLPLEIDGQPSVGYPDEGFVVLFVTALADKVTIQYGCDTGQKENKAF
jgi:hypothetical protein